MTTATITNGSQTFTADQVAIARTYCRMSDQRRLTSQMAAQQETAGNEGTARRLRADAGELSDRMFHFARTRTFLTEMAEAASHLGFDSLTDYLDDLEARNANRVDVSPGRDYATVAARSDRPTMPRTAFTILVTLHDNCAACEALSGQARDMARCLGSTEGSQIDDRTACGGDRHGVTVRRLSVVSL